MPWPTDDLSTANLDEVSDNPVASLPEIYKAVQKLQAVLAELTAGDTVLSAENAASNNIAVTNANNNFSTTQTLNTGNVSGVIVNTTDPDWNNPYNFYRAGTANDGFRIVHTAPAASGGYMALQVGNGSGVNDRLRLYQGTQRLDVQATDVLFNNVSLLNNAKPKGAWDDGQINGPFTNGVWKGTGGSSIAWTPTGDYNRIMVCATVEWPNGGQGGGATMSLRVTRDGANFRTQQMWAEEAQQGNATIFIWTGTTSAATWAVEMMHNEGFESRVANAQFRTTLGIWEVNA